MILTRRLHPRHNCSGKRGTRRGRQHPDASHPAADLKVADETPPSPPATRETGGSAAARGVLWLRRSDARENCEPVGALLAGATRLFPLASLAYDDLPVRKTALLFFYFGCLGECTLALEVWTRAGSLMRSRGQEDTGPGLPLGFQSWECHPISVPGILCLKHSLQRLVVNEGMKDIRS